MTLRFFRIARTRDYPTFIRHRRRVERVPHSTEMGIVQAANRTGARDLARRLYDRELTLKGVSDSDRSVLLDAFYYEAFEA